jgi:tetratricopeptide (TPR) repeat protein
VSLAERTVRLKGGGGASALVARAKREADSAIAREDLDRAIAAYGHALSAPDVSAVEVAAVAAHIASLYLRQGRTREALALARLAVQVEPDDVDNLQALATAAEAAGERRESETAAARAATIQDAAK